MSFPVDTSNFGTLTVADDQILTFPNGLIGVPHRRWVLVTREPDSPFLFLQSLDDPELALPVTAPEIFYPNFELRLADQQLEGLDLADGDLAEVMCVVRSAQDIREFKINLQGPLVINDRTRVGAQLVNFADYPVAADLWAQRGINQIEATPPNLPFLVVSREESS